MFDELDLDQKKGRFILGGKAKKDFVLHQNDIHIELKEGDDIDKKKIPKRFETNLKKEGVL